VETPRQDVATRGQVDERIVLATWWPLAASWLMMGLELPAVSAVMARLPGPEISLAAYGGVIFPLALVVEAPIIMLLAASTALSRDRPSYRKLRRFMWAAAGTLTALHVAIAVTPLWDLVVVRLMGAPEAIRPAARLGLLIMTPWTGAIAYRRFQQGVLIRFGRSGTVGVGTAVRLVTNGLVLAAGWTLHWPGIVTGTAAIAVGVTAEALFIGLCVRPVLRDRLPDRDPEARPLTRRSFLAFYVPLAMTSVLTLLVLPLGSAAMSRLPRALESLAAWPVLNGLTFTLRSLGFAYNEVVVSLIDRPGAHAALRRFTIGLATLVSTVLLAVAATPLSHLWFSGVSGLAEPLATLAASALWIAIPLPALSVFQSWFTGILVNRHHTRGVSEAIGLALGIVVTLLGVAVATARFPGLYAVVGSMLVGHFGQVAWLAVRSGTDRRALAAPGAAALE
jgi:hypothetical protein